jgi:hypothetical protein
MGAYADRKAKRVSKQPTLRHPQVAELNARADRRSDDPLHQECLDLLFHLPPKQQREVLILTLMAVVDQLSNGRGDQ